MSPAATTTAAARAKKTQKLREREREDGGGRGEVDEWEQGMGEREEFFFITSDDVVDEDIVY